VGLARDIAIAAAAAAAAMYDNRPGQSAVPQAVFWMGRRGRGGALPVVAVVVFFFFFFFFFLFFSSPIKVSFRLLSRRAQILTHEHVGVDIGLAQHHLQQVAF
jgi:hypothetical protein